MEAVASIMKSGVFAELVGGMGNGLQDGSLDLGKLMGTVQTMVSTLSGDGNGVGAPAGTGGENPMELISTMMGSINAGAQSGKGGNPGAPDLSGMMNMMGPMLGALTSAGGGAPVTGGGGVEEQIEAQVAEARKNGVLSNTEVGKE